jgi:hypothetical protein
MNPSLAHPTGLFWTLPVPADGIDVDFDEGVASLEAFHVPIFDYGNVLNSLFPVPGGPPPIPGTVSFKVVWSGVGERVKIKNNDPVFGGFAGEFVRNSAQMEWTGTVGDFTLLRRHSPRPRVHLLKSDTNVMVPSFETVMTQQETVVMQ